MTATTTVAHHARAGWAGLRARAWLSRWGRLLGGALLIGLLVRRLGTGPFVHGIRTLDGWSLAAAACLAVLTTVCAAWRWHLVAGALEVPVHLRSAVAACYRAQFLNVTLPGGVLGDVHRGVRHGRGQGQVARGLRAVGWERSAGQAVQLVLAGVVLLALPAGLGTTGRALGVLALAGVVGCVVAVRRLPDAGASPVARVARVLRADLSALSPDPAVRVRVVLASVVVVAGHVATFGVAARVTGAAVPLSQLVPVALLVLVVSGLPTNIAGWGPREGAAAWAFAAVGLDAAQGLAAAVAYGVLVFVASLPGAAVLVREGVSRA
jgi:uncharacterized membrane protein YbhN (UPF0104 family)